MIVLFRAFFCFYSIILNPYDFLGPLLQAAIFQHFLLDHIDVGCYRLLSYMGIQQSIYRCFDDCFAYPALGFAFGFEVVVGLRFELWALDRLC